MNGTLSFLVPLPSIFQLTFQPAGEMLAGRPLRQLGHTEAEQEGEGAVQYQIAAAGRGP